MKKYALLVLLLTLLGCNQEPNCYLESEGNELKIEIEVPLLQRYSISFPIIRDDDFYGFVGYNNANHSIDVFKNGQLFFLIKLSFEGPSGIDEIRGVKEFAEDKFIIISRNKIRMIDINGSTLNEVVLSDLVSNSPSGLDLSQYQPIIKPEKGLDFHYDHLKNVVYVPLNDFSLPEWVSPEAYHPGRRFIGKVNLKTKEFQGINVDYPEFISNELFGTLSEVNTTFDGSGNIIYGFDGFPDIFVYNLTDETLEHIPNRDNYKIIPSLMNKDDLFGYSKDKVRFYRLVYNTLDHTLYQIVMRPHPEGGYNTFVRLFDDNYAFKSESQLGKGISAQSLLFAKNGLYCLNMISDENVINYVNVNFHCGMK